MATEAQLREYLRNSRSVQRAMWWILGIGLALTLLVLLAPLPRMAAFALFVITVVVAGAGLWITHGHIEDFEKQLRAQNRTPSAASRA